MIEDFAKLIPHSLLDKSGGVFYSGRNAFSTPSKLYILGLNPGGDPSDPQSDTVGQHTARILKEAPDDWSAYRDDSWAGRAPGSYTMQPRVLHLLKQVGLSPGDVPASNIIFLSSRREANISGDVEELKNACWSLHKAVIEKLQVSVILCFGKTSGQWVCNQLGALKQIDEFVERNERRWRSSSYTNNKGLRVVVAAHPSIADWTATNTDPSILVANALEP